VEAEAEKANGQPTPGPDPESTAEAPDEKLIHQATHTLPNFTFRIEVVTRAGAGAEKKGLMLTPDLVTSVHLPESLTPSPDHVEPLATEREPLIAFPLKEPFALEASISSLVEKEGPIVPESSAPPMLDSPSITSSTESIAGR
jgi:hypothetical protein